MLRHPLWGAICLLAVSLVLCTDKLCTDARPSAYALLVDDDDDEEDGGDGSSSFSFSSPQATPDELAFGFYDGTCPNAEAVVASTVRELFAGDPNVAAALVRLFFHDCFVHVRAHSIGKVQCRFFRDRIYNFAGTGEPDDSLDADMVGEMRAVCSGDGAAPMEMGYYRQGREVGFGAHYYAKLLAGRGILRSDQQLTAGSTVRWVRAYASGHRGEEAFREDFAHAMVKLSALAPLTGSAGQVRISCSKSVE
ncbi:Putative Peroxidase 48 [Triticum urartu]|uniref:Plant heme peroxidase family profile domain-containing protein n=2 Tax=Triticum TaxID=4564 RepID=A0A9R0VN04_TRITD|nr:Putative Peroxidase 48 [Triticum urartu]VAH62600.1 unnamed protein product [Triticum turgidum subsp. durum]